MNVKQILGSLFSFKLNGELDAAEAAGYDHGRALGERYFGGLRKGALEAAEEGRSLLLGFPAPEPPTGLLEAPAKATKKPRK